MKLKRFNENNNEESFLSILKDGFQFFLSDDLYNIVDLEFLPQNNKLTHYLVKFKFNDNYISSIPRSNTINTTDKILKQAEYYEKLKTIMITCKKSLDLISDDISSYNITIDSFINGTTGVRENRISIEIKSNKINNKEITKYFKISNNVVTVDIIGLKKYLTTNSPGFTAYDIKKLSIDNIPIAITAPKPTLIISGDYVPELEDIRINEIDNIDENLLHNNEKLFTEVYNLTNIDYYEFNDSLELNIHSLRYDLF